MSLTPEQWVDKYSNDVTSIVTSDGEFIEESLLEYNEHAIDKMNKVNGAVLEVIDWEPDDEDSPLYDRALTPEERQFIIANILDKYGLSGSEKISLDNCNVVVNDILDFLLNKYHAYQNNLSDAESEIAIVKDSILTTYNSLTNETINTYRVSASDLVDKLQRAQAASVSMGAALYARVKGKALDIAGRLQIYRDRFQRVYSSTTGKFSEMYNYYKTVISDQFSSLQSVAWIRSVTGIDDALNDQVGLWTPESTDVVKFTGATPLSGLTIQTPLELLAAPFVAAWKFISQGFKSLATGVVSWFASSSKTVYQNTLDTMDVTRAWSDGGETFDQFYRSISGSIVPVVSGAIAVGNGQAIMESNEWFTTVAEEEGKWYRVDNLFCEVLMNAGAPYRDDLLTKLWADSNSSISAGNTRILVKPKVLNPYAVRACWPVGSTTNITYYSTFKQFLENCAKYGNKLYYDSTDKSLETAVFVGARMGLILGAYLAAYSRSMMVGSNSDRFDVPIPYILSNDWNLIFDNDNHVMVSVSNKDWFNLLAGYDGTYFGRAAGLYVLPNSGFEHIDDIMSWYCNYLDVTLGAVATNKMVPNQAVFYPYTTSEVNFRKSNWYLKTDADNQSEVSIFWSRIVTVAVTIFVATAIVTTVGAISRRMYINKVRKLGMMDNAMWNGQKLTSKQTKQYIRLQRKLNGSGAASSGLVGFDSAVEKIQQLTGSTYASADNVQSDIENVNTDITDKLLVIKNLIV